MDEIFLTILNMSLTGSFVIAAICFVRLFLKKAPKIISYCLWMAAGFRLLFPLSIESVFSLIPFKAQTIPANIATQPIPQIDSGIPYVNNAVNNAVSSILPASAPQVSVNPLQIWIVIGAFVWFTGVAAMFTYGAVSYIILKRKMKNATHIKENIYESGNIISPFMLGFFKPRIYLPSGLSIEESFYIIRHEQTHIRRYDHIVKFAAYFILCLHWFNPTVWVAFLLMSDDMEMSCDESVLEETGGEIKKDYSLSLLSLATERRFVSGSPLAFSERGIKGRIKNILNFKKSSPFVITLAVALVIVLIIGFSMSKAVDRSLPMQGPNLADLQPDKIIHHVVQVTGAKDENIIVPGDNFELNVSGDFDFIHSGTISMVISKSKTGGRPYFASQLRIFDHDQKFLVTEPYQIDSPQSQYLLKHYLDALKYLPQEHIRGLTHDNPDAYIINLTDDDVADDNQPYIFYNMNGFTDRNGWQIRLDILPLYQDEEGSGFHGSGSDVIHAFYVDDALQPLGTPGGSLDGKPMTLDDVKDLAAKGDNLLFEDLMQFNGANVSSSFDRYIMVYGVEGGYRLVVSSKSMGKPDRADLERIWDSGGSGIDIRYKDVDEFVKAHPSHPASPK